MRFRASGGSMRPAVRDGDVITVAPAARASLVPGNVLLYRRFDRLFAHRVVSVAMDNGECRAALLRGDAMPACDAPVAPEQVLGELVTVSRGPAESNFVRITALASRVMRRVRRMSAAAMVN